MKCALLTPTPYCVLATWWMPYPFPGSTFTPVHLWPPVLEVKRISKMKNSIINTLLRKKGIWFERTNTFLFKKNELSGNSYHGIWLWTRGCRLATAPRRQAGVTARCCWLQEEPKPLLPQMASRDGNFSRVCGLDGCTALQILSGGLTRVSRWRCHCFWLMGPDVPPDFNFPLHPYHKSILHRVKARWVVLSRPGFPGFWCQREVTVRQKMQRCRFGEQRCLFHLSHECKSWCEMKAGSTAGWKSSFQSWTIKLKILKYAKQFCSLYYTRKIFQSSNAYLSYNFRVQLGTTDLQTLWKMECPSRKVADRANLT